MNGEVPEILEGWLYKRAPRLSDSDKHRLKRMLSVNFQKYKRRWFVFTSEYNTIRYYDDGGTSGRVRSALGVIDVRMVSAVHSKRLDPSERTPTPHIFNIITSYRTYTLCAETEEERDKWLRALGPYVNRIGATQEEVPLEEAAQRIPLTPRTFNEMQANKKGKGGMAAAAAGRRSSAAGGFAFDDDEIKEAEEGDGAGGGVRHATRASVIIRNIRTQSERVALFRGTTAHITGDLPFLGLSYFAEYELENLKFMGRFAEVCQHPDPYTYVEQNLLARARFCMPAEGDDLLKEGNPVDFVYFILTGEVLRTKTVYGVEKELSSLEAGDWFGAAECAYDGPALFSYLASAETVVMALPAKEMQRAFKDPNLDLQQLIKQENTHRLTAECMACLPLFADYSRDVLWQMVQHFQPKTYAPGTQLVRERDPPDYFYIILQGSAKVTKMDSEGKQHHVFTNRAGDWFGELGLLKNQPRTATVTSLDRLTALVSERDGFFRFLELGGDVLQQTVERNISNHMSRTVSKIPLFEEFEGQHEMISANMMFQEYPAGSEVCIQGAPVPGFFVIMHGEVLATMDHLEDLELRRNETDPRVVLGRLGENDFFGDAELLYTGSVSMYTMVTSTACVMLWAPADLFQEILSKCPNLTAKLERIRESKLQELDEKRQMMNAIERAILERDASPAPNMATSSSSAAGQGQDGGGNANGGGDCNGGAKSRGDSASVGVSSEPTSATGIPIPGHIRSSISGGTRLSIDGLASDKQRLQGEVDILRRRCETLEEQALIMLNTLQEGGLIAQLPSALQRDLQKIAAELDDEESPITPHSGDRLDVGEAVDAVASAGGLTVRASERWGHKMTDAGNSETQTANTELQTETDKDGASETTETTTTTTTTTASAAVAAADIVPFSAAAGLDDDNVDARADADVPPAPQVPPPPPVDSSAAKPPRPSQPPPNRWREGGGRASMTAANVRSVPPPADNNNKS